MSLRALIIDKDEAVAGQLADALIRRSYEVDVCATGREGIDRARATMPDVVVLCVELEDTSGYSVCAKLKKDADLKVIPLVITSEKATQETFEHHQKLKTRAQRYVMKPFDSEALAEELGQLVGPPAADTAEEVALEDVELVDVVDAGVELDAAIASLTDEPPPLPDEMGLESVAGLPESYDEDEVRTTIGQLPSDFSAAPSSNTQDLPHDALVRRLKEAERARDAALAAARSSEAQLRALTEGTSQIPAATGSSRELLAVKKELNAKEREALELKDTVQQRDRQLLDARDREADLEERLVQAEEAKTEADRARVNAEGRIAGAEARADEVERTSRAAIDELDRQLEEESQRARTLEGERDEARSRIAELEGTLAERDRTIEDRDGAIAALEGKLADTEQRLAQETERLEGELARARENIEGLEARSEGLQGELDEARKDNEALRGRLSDTEERLAREEETNRGHVELRSKTQQALQITLNMLAEAEADGELIEGIDAGSEGSEDEAAEAY